MPQGDNCGPITVSLVPNECGPSKVPSEAGCGDGGASPVPAEDSLSSFSTCVTGDFSVALAVPSAPPPPPPPSAIALVRINKVNPATFGVLRIWFGAPDVQGIMEVTSYEVVGPYMLPDPALKYAKPLSLGNGLWVIPAQRPFPQDGDEGYYFSSDDGASWEYQTPPDNFVAGTSLLGFMRLLPDGQSIECFGHVPNATSRAVALRKAQLVAGSIVWGSKTSPAAFQDAVEQNHPSDVCANAAEYISAFFRGIRRIPSSWDAFFNKQTPFSGPSGNFYPTWLDANGSGVVVGVQYRVFDDTNRRWRSVDGGLTWSTTELFNTSHTRDIVYAGSDVFMLVARDLVHRSFDNGASWEAMSAGNEFNRPFDILVNPTSLYHGQRSPFSQSVICAGSTTDGINGDGLIGQCSSETVLGSEWVWDRYLLADVSNIGELSFNLDLIPG